MPGATAPSGAPSPRPSCLAPSPSGGSAPARVPGLRDGIALGHEGLALVERVVLAQRVPFELRVHEDAAEIGMPGEADAEHVPHLALGPVGALPHAGRRRD